MPGMFQDEIVRTPHTESRHLIPIQIIYADNMGVCMEQVQPQEAQHLDDGFSQFFAATEPTQQSELTLTPDAQEIMVNLLNAFRRLRAASYRIGYLEGQLNRYRKLSRTLLSQAQLSRGVAAAEPPAVPGNHGPHGEGMRKKPPFEAQPHRESLWELLVEEFLGVDQRKASASGKKLAVGSYYDLIRFSISND